MNARRERLLTNLQEPRRSARSLHAERIVELARLRNENRTLRIENERWQMIVAEYKELLRDAEPCPACVAKGE